MISLEEICGRSAAAGHCSVIVACLEGEVQLDRGPESQELAESLTVSCRQGSAGACSFLKHGRLAQAAALPAWGCLGHKRGDEVRSRPPVYACLAKPGS